MKVPFFALAILMASGAANAESAITVRAAEVQADAQSDSAIVVTLPGNAQVEVLGRKGAWSQIKTASGQRGWVRMQSLKPASGAQPAADSPVGTLNKLLSSGRTSNTATVTTGVRGLPREPQNEADDVKRAQEFEGDKAGMQ